MMTLQNRSPSILKWQGVANVFQWDLAAAADATAAARCVHSLRLQFLVAEEEIIKVCVYLHDLAH